MSKQIPVAEVKGKTRNNSHLVDDGHCCNLVSLYQSLEDLRVDLFSYMSIFMASSEIILHPRDHLCSLLP